MQEELRKLQQTKNKQKTIEKRLKQEIGSVYGSEDLIYEKQDKYNYIINEVANLQKKYDAEKAEEKDIKRFKDQAGAPKSKLTRQIKEVTKQVMTAKAEYREMLVQSKSIATERDTYFRAVSENQKLRRTHKRTSSQSNTKEAINSGGNIAGNSHHYQAMGGGGAPGRKSSNQ